LYCSRSSPPKGGGEKEKIKEKKKKKLVFVLFGLQHTPIQLIPHPLFPKKEERKRKEREE